MLDTFKARLKAKYSGVNLSQKRIDAIAERLHKKFPDITEETDHDGKIEDYYDEDSIKEIAKQDDQLRTLQSKQPPKTEPEPGESNPGKPEPGKEVPTEMPAWFKPFADEINNQKAEKQKQSLHQKVKETLKEVPEKFWSKRALPAKEEDIDAFTKEVVEDFKDFAPVDFTPGKSAGKVPAKGASDKQVNELVDNIMGVQPEQK